MYFTGCVLLVGLWMVLFPGGLGLIMALCLLAVGAAARRSGMRKAFFILLHCFVYTQVMSALLRSLILPEIRYHNSPILLLTLLILLAICLGIVTQSYVVGGISGTAEYSRRSLWWLFELVGVCLGLAITSWIQLPSQLNQIWHLGIILLPWVCADALAIRMARSSSGCDFDWQQLFGALAVLLGSFITFLAVGVGKYLLLTSHDWYYSFIVDVDVPSAWAHLTGDFLVLLVVLLAARKFARRAIG